MKAEMGMIFGFATALVCIMAIMLTVAGVIVPGLSSMILGAVEMTDLLVVSGAITWGGAILTLS